MDDILEMEEWEDDDDDESMGEEGHRGGLEEVTRNLEREGGDTSSPVRTRRSVEVSTVTPKGSTLIMSSFIPHTYRHERVILDASV